jgi:hypothetical protein
VVSIVPSANTELNSMFTRSPACGLSRIETPAKIVPDSSA